MCRACSESARAHRPPRPACRGAIAAASVDTPRAPSGSTPTNSPLAAANAAVSTVAQAPAAEAWPVPAFRDVPPRPIVRHHISDEVAEMLATLPRKKWDESTWAALGGAVAAFPSAVEAVVHGFQQQPFSLHWFEATQIAIFLCFLVWLISRKRSKHENTSIDVLNELRSREGASAEGGSGVI